MSGFVKPLLAILSVTLNGAFIAAYLSHRQPSDAHSTEHMQSSGCAYLDNLKLSPDQRTTILARLEAFRESSDQQCKEISKLRHDLIDLLAAKEPNMAEIKAKQEEILAGHRKMQEMVVAQLLAEKSNLNPEQQEALFHLIRVGCGCAKKAEFEKNCDQESDSK